jgi:hypothetical protein
VPHLSQRHRPSTSSRCVCHRSAHRYRADIPPKPSPTAPSNHQVAVHHPRWRFSALFTSETQVWRTIDTMRHFYPNNPRIPPKKGVWRMSLLPAGSKCSPRDNRPAQARAKVGDRSGQSSCRPENLIEQGSGRQLRSRMTKPPNRAVLRTSNRVFAERLPHSTEFTEAARTQHVPARR